MGGPRVGAGGISAKEQHLSPIPQRGSAVAPARHRRQLPPRAGSRVVRGAVPVYPGQRPGDRPRHAAGHDQFLAGPRPHGVAPHGERRDRECLPGVGRGNVGHATVGCPGAADTIPDDCLAAGPRHHRPVVSGRLIRDRPPGVRGRVVGAGGHPGNQHLRSRPDGDVGRLTDDGCRAAGESAPAVDSGPVPQGDGGDLGPRAVADRVNDHLAAGPDAGARPRPVGDGHAGMVRQVPVGNGAGVDAWG